MFFLLVVIFAVFVFEYINGFHDAANAIATVVSTRVLTPRVAVMLAGICWNLFTWWLGLPTSSSHALIGGLCGAALASAGGHWSVIKWSLHKINPQTGAASWDGLLPKVILPMIGSPIAGLVGGFIIMNLLFILVHRW